jgi:periplasmic divalent cation tolerance protein
MSSKDTVGVVVVLTTAPDEQVAERIGATLVEERLIACANLVPRVRSIYRWEGAVQRDDEVLVVMKTTTDALELLRERLVALHPYDVPEMLAVPSVDGLGAYLSWIREAVEADRE